jgi:surface polysaccharide O-acyltransferase-like enzyme
LEPVIARHEGEKPGKRLLYIDNLRLMIIVFVVMHHLAVSISGFGSWYYMTNTQLDIISTVWFAFYLSFQQGYFLGLLFLIAGYFEAGSYDRKGFGGFVKARFVRLIIPTLIYMVAISPFIEYVELGQPFTGFSLTGFLSSTGVMWFVVALFFFSLVYALVRLLAGRPGLVPPPAPAVPAPPAGATPVSGSTNDSARDSAPAPMPVPAGTNPVPAPAQGSVPAPVDPAIRAGASTSTPAPGHAPTPASASPSPRKRRIEPSFRNALLLILAIAVSAFLIRIVQPIGTSVLNMQLCYFASYIALFIVGIDAYRNNLFSRIPARTGKRWLIAGIVLGFFAWFALAIVATFTGTAALLNGGLTWQSAAYSLWESFVAVAMSIGLIVIFRDALDRQNTLVHTMTQNSYAVYMFHPPIIVGVTLLLAAAVLYPIAEWLMLCVICVPLCFLLTHFIVRKIPGLKDIL